MNEKTYENLWVPICGTYMYEVMCYCYSLHPTTIIMYTCCTRYLPINLTRIVIRFTFSCRYLGILCIHVTMRCITLVSAGCNNVTL